MAAVRPVLVFVLIGLLSGEVSSVQYFGKLIGKLSELHHGVSGEVYAVDSRTLYIKDFTYDGQGPAAYFYAGNTRTPGNSGFRLRDEKGSGEVIRRYRKEGVTLSLPEGKTLNNIKIFYVWCEEFAVNFGDVKIPRNFDYPRPVKVDQLQGVHGVSSDNVVIVDAQTLLIPNFSYDGEAPDAKFWVGRGSKPSPQGTRIPDENGKEKPLRRYDRKTIVLTLPGDLTVFEIGHFGVWCEAFTVDFGHILIPQNLNVPPSLKMLGVSPQKNHQQQDNTRRGVSRPHNQIGGNVEATTYRPRGFHFLANRRSDQGVQQHELFHRDISQLTNQNSVVQNVPPQHQRSFQQHYIPLNNDQDRFRQIQAQQSVENSVHQNYIQPAQQYSQIPQHIPFQNQYFQQNQVVRQPMPYLPFNSQYQGDFNSRNAREQQLIQNLNRQHNRFSVANPNAYLPLQ
ncbi:protein Skeletor, isoforms B/C isoform X3 [Coccinella septempunctata]|uniref:protein Skeletor, isoforms B/C isoform X3 n=1 Tax=Coccinella septempunctata TaxID=41139 RepID=UPI001D05EF62|nr:protein Skeletor, isoforms B/C isoform X3 [Coccinella septempunctata]